MTDFLNPDYVYYACLAFALTVAALAVVLKAVALWRQHKINKRRRRRGGDITEELARRVRFFDDQWDPAQR